MYINQFHLTWEDMSSNEDGFCVYRDGTLVAEVTADRTDLVDEFILRNIRSHYYYVAAYNGVGEAKGSPSFVAQVEAVVADLVLER